MKVAHRIPQFTKQSQLSSCQVIFVFSFALKLVLPNSKICVSEKSVLSNSVWSMLATLFRSVRTVFGLFVRYLLCQLNILLPYIIKNFLFVTYYLCVCKTAMCRIYKFVTYVVLFYCLQFLFSSPGSLCFQLEKTVFRLFP